ncbi:MAG: tetratricopeptide repeat protein [Bacteroidales bacterium]|nr:tetratricopeptide repeat protein [Bacteroidales bacterium]MCF8390532.1 tetratricopeptide repeat protein [Bacteroidales bacterium]
MKASFHKYLITAIFIIASCSTEKNTFTSRSYHNLTSNYNIYFNGYESYKKGVDKAEDNFQDNYSRILPLFYFSSPDVAQSVAPDMQRSLEKSTKVISLHSITAKPEIKKGTQTDKQKEFYNQKEFNKWIDENYVLMGKAYVYKNEFYLALETFRKVIRDFPNTESKYEALIWMARTYDEQGEFREAEKILADLVKDKELPKRLREDLHITYADYYIKHEAYEDAIKQLQTALDFTRKKQNKIRYNYILAQLFQEVESADMAIKTYQKVIKMNPPYEMIFNAKINMASSFEAGSNRGKEFQTILKKMLKDDKNIEYQDQIYYALGNIAMKQGKNEEAINLFKLSAQKSQDNLNQKGLSYLAIGDIYYSIPEYSLSQAYYDSCLQNIDKQHDNYEELSLKARSLTKLVVPLNIFTLEDSLQTLSKLPQKDLFTVIDGIIAEVVKKEEEERERKAQEMEDMQYDMAIGNQNQSQRETQSQTGTWYFYNMNAKSFGQPEFRLKWGNRRLEDNWRRKNKQSVEFVETTVEGEFADTSATEEVVIINNKSREFYMMGIPFSDSAYHESDLRIEKALYEMGTVYLNELKDKKEAVYSFEEGLKRYPKGDYAVLSAYSLYEFYLLNGPKEKAEFYKNYIITNFPDNPRAKILSNPEYVKKLLEDQNQVNVFYETCYNLFNAGNFSNVIASVNRALTEFAGDKNIPKFMLLKALSIGRLEGNDRLTDELDKIIEAYPDNEESVYAKNLKEYVYNISPEIAIADVQAKATEIYVYSETEPAYYFGVAAPDLKSLNQLNFNLINFNLDYYNKNNYGIIKEEIGGKTILFIKDFKDFKSISEYFNSYIEHESEVFKDLNKSELNPFFISEKNYSTLKEDTDIRKYYLYFRKFY